MWSAKQYRENRAAFPAAELASYHGQWVAFSLDGRRILAADEDLNSLEALLVAAGHNPEQVAFEHIEGEDTCLGGAEFI